ncbi:MAG: hypothetical protein KC656_08195 [Myxococcales bacterium]|nr:hypothetical protein [Myxococcales bacterium]MCB9668166.1 hypothetical protein [Alphaproteobacteria bacterium]MCB9692505.1 hypothetical protein [Alphaproteobacteria bacterium]
MIPALLALLAGPAHAEPLELPCCSDPAASKTLTYYLRVRSSLLTPGDERWSGHVSAWLGHLQSGRASTPEEAAVREELRKTVGELQRTWKKQAFAEGFSRITPHVVFLLLRHPGGSRGVAEAVCGSEHWLQPLDEPLKAVVEGCGEPRWLTEP